MGNGVAGEIAGDGCKQKRKGHGRARLQGDDRKGKQDIGSRRDMRDALEYKLRKAEGVAPKLRVGGKIARGGRHRRSPCRWNWFN